MISAGCMQDAHISHSTCAPPALASKKHDGILWICYEIITISPHAYRSTWLSHSEWCAACFLLSPLWMEPNSSNFHAYSLQPLLYLLKCTFSYSSYWLNKLALKNQRSRYSLNPLDKKTSSLSIVCISWIASGFHFLFLNCHMYFQNKWFLQNF